MHGVSRKSDPKYPQFYMKRLQTQSFSSPSLRDSFVKLTDKIEREIQGKSQIIEVVKKNLRVKNLKMYRAKEKIKAIQKNQSIMRDTLRSKIEGKLKASEQNLQKLMLKKNSQSKSKDKFRQTTISRIKSMEKTFVEQSFRKSQMMSTDSQKYLTDKRNDESMTRATSFLQTSSKNRFFEDDGKPNQSVQVQSRKRILPHVLKITDREIRRKQTKKNDIQMAKDIKNLHQYIEKLTQIDNKRKNRSNKLNETVKLIEKQRKKQEEKYQIRRKHQSTGQKDKLIKNYNSATKAAIQNKYSFSELYAKKLEEKMAIKSFFLGQSLQDGDRVMRKESQLKKLKKEGQIIGETLKEVQRGINFKNREKGRK